MKNLKYLLLGVFLGIILTKSEVISWFRIQEMFRFQSFHMYGIIGSAILVGAVFTQLIKRYHLKTVTGELIEVQNKPLHKGTIIGGIIFGFGWALTGACPGPLFALVGGGHSIILVALASAIFGTWVYGYFQARLPH
ncbi:MAG TPA: DUF6691 family protein [Cyclobacteriaceae bacterium]|nr:DUF6691 family protein [Cyclobacteriaceae bacterium]